MEKSRFGKAHRLGILGGGQLGRMFIQEAVNYDVGVHIMENDESAPSSSICNIIKFHADDQSIFYKLCQIIKCLLI